MQARLTMIAALGLTVAGAALGSGLTFLVLGKGAAGLTVLASGMVLGGALLLIGWPQERVVVQSSVRPAVAGKGPSSAREAAPVDIREAATQPEGPKAQYTPAAAAPVPVASPYEETMHHSFVPSAAAHALAGLDDLYREMEAPGVRAMLLVIAGPDRKQSIALRKDPVTIGRGLENSLRLTDAGVSSEQAKVVYEGGRVTLKDNESKNGTFVNNQRVGTQPLENCDVIAFGATKILVTLPG
jgi:hypothetical protein